MIWLIIGAGILTLVIVGLLIGIALMDGWRVSLAVAGIVVASLVVIGGGTVAPRLRDIRSHHPNRTGVAMTGTIIYEPSSILAVLIALFWPLVIPVGWVFRRAFRSGADS